MPQMAPLAESQTQLRRCVTILATPSSEMQADSCEFGLRADELANRLPPSPAVAEHGEDAEAEDGEGGGFGDG